MDILKSVKELWDEVTTMVVYCIPGALLASFINYWVHGDVYESVWLFFELIGLCVVFIAFLLLITRGLVKLHKWLLGGRGERVA